MANIKPREPAGLGLCTRFDLQNALDKAGYSADAEQPEAEGQPETPEI